MNRSDLVSYLDALLNLAALPDYGPQGLQVEGREEAHTLAVGVDAAHPASRRRVASAPATRLCYTPIRSIFKEVDST